VNTENQQTTVDKRHTENQQTNNCGQTPHSKPTDKQLWKNTTQKTKHSADTNPTEREDKRQTTVDTENQQTTVNKRHTENQ
jgi:hypothetical protein